MDCASRRVLSWRVSNTLTTDFCIEAVQEAIARYGAPEIFNTDQGSQFTSLEFTQLLKEYCIAISMDGKGCWRDNVFVERLWKSIKYEEVYLHAYDTVSAAKSGIGRYLEFYNSTIQHPYYRATKNPLSLASLARSRCLGRGCRHQIRLAGMSLHTGTIRI